MAVDSGVITGGEAGLYYLSLDYDLREVVQDLPGRQWDTDERAHSLPADLVGPAARELRLHQIGLATGHPAPAPWPPAPPRAPQFLPPPLSEQVRALPLRPYQLECLEFLQDSPFRCLLAALDMGLGKSLLAVAAGLALGGPRLIVIPAIVRSVWSGTDYAKGEIEKWAPGADVRILLHRQQIDATLLENVTENTWVVANYEILDHQERKSGRSISSWLPLIKAIPWRLIVLDEAHAVKKRRSKRTAAMIEIRNAAPDAYRLALTGTPIHNRPKDLWQLLDWLAPSNFGAYWAFARRYTDAHEGAWGWIDTGVSNAAELKHRLQWYMIRRTKAEVAHLLPPKTRQVLAYTPSAADAKAVDGAARALFEHARAEGRKITKAEIVALSYSFTSRKFATLMELLQARSGRTVVFLHRRACASELFRTLAAAGYPVFGIHGEIPPEKRIPSLNDFRVSHDGILIATMGVAGLGIDLSCAATAVFLDVDPVPGVMLQCEDRLWRPPQNAAVTIVYVVIRSTVDEQMARLVVRKLDQTMAILGQDGEAASYRDALDKATGTLSDEAAALASLQNMLHGMFGGAV